MKESILLLGGSAQQIPAIEAAKALGYRTVLCDYLPDNPGQYHADVFYPVSTTDREAVLAVARREGVSGVLAYASDPAAPTAAYATEKLGLSGNPLASVETLCEKDRFRAFLKKEGFPVPQAAAFSAVEEALAAQKAFSYPLLVKPVDASGSKGVTMLKAPEGFEDALRRAMEFSRAKRVIVEQYIQCATPYLTGGDIFVKDGEIVLWGLLSCHRDRTGSALVPVGKSYPPALRPEELAAVQQTLRCLVSALAIRDGAMNVEAVIGRDGQVYLIDVGPRCGGNLIPLLLGDLFSVDLAKLCVQAAMGRGTAPEPAAPKGCRATYNLHSRRGGKYAGIEFDRALKPYLYRQVLYCRPGDRVFPFSHAAHCLGILFLQFPDEMQMEQTLSGIDRMIHIQLDD